MKPSERAKETLELTADTVEIAGALSFVAEKLHKLRDYNAEYFCKEARDNLLSMHEGLTLIAKGK